jgi:hypothetical protein
MNRLELIWQEVKFLLQNPVILMIMNNKRCTTKKTMEEQSLRGNGLIKAYFELHSPSIIRMIKSRGMRWAGHVA